MKNLLVELRIGNWLFSEGKFFCVTEALFPHLLLKRTSKFEPIRLTPQIIECAGFRTTSSFFDSKKMIEGVIYDNYCVDPNDEYGISYYFSLCELGVMSTDPNLQEPLVIIKEVHYLHQLQNLIYSLFKTEIKVEFHKSYLE